jgi:Family of unknown function (DUF6157)
MKLHTTNYINTFIEIADDCPAVSGEVPPLKGNNKTLANLQFDMLIKSPYQYSSDDVLFEIVALKNDVTKQEYKEARDNFFSKGQPCFRASPLTKRYGWGVHHNEEGKIAIYGVETMEYKRLANDKNLKLVKALKTSK